MAWPSVTHGLRLFGAVASPAPEDEAGESIAYSEGDEKRSR